MTYKCYIMDFLFFSQNPHTGASFLTTFLRGALFLTGFSHGIRQFPHPCHSKKAILQIEKEREALVTDSDCVNICAAQIAKKVFHIPKVVARIYDEEKTSLVKNMGIDTICPAELSEKEIANYIQIGGVDHVG